MTDDNLQNVTPPEDGEPEPIPEVFASDGPLPKVMTAYEVADLLRVSYRVILTMAKDGDIPAFVVAGQWRFSTEMILKWIDNQALSNYTGYPKL